MDSWDTGAAIVGIGSPLSRLRRCHSLSMRRCRTIRQIEFACGRTRQWSSCSVRSSKASLRPNGPPARSRAVTWARAAFNIAFYTLMPFGSRAVNRFELTGMEDTGTGLLGVIGNLIWLVLAGWWLALGHLIFAVVWAITIVGLPFAWAHLKLAGIALWPIGKMIVPADQAAFHYARRS